MPRKEQESVAMVSRVRACVPVHLCLQCLLGLKCLLFAGKRSGMQSRASQASSLASSGRRGKSLRTLMRLFSEVEVVEVRGRGGEIQTHCARKLPF